MLIMTYLINRHVTVALHDCSGLQGASHSEVVHTYHEALRRCIQEDSRNISEAYHQQGADRFIKQFGDWIRSGAATGIDLKLYGLEILVTPTLVDICEEVRFDVRIYKEIDIITIDDKTIESDYCSGTYRRFEKGLGAKIEQEPDLYVPSGEVIENSWMVQTFLDNVNNLLSGSPFLIERYRLRFEKIARRVNEERKYYSSESELLNLVQGNEYTAGASLIRPGVPESEYFKQIGSTGSVLPGTIAPDLYFNARNTVVVDKFYNCNFLKADKFLVRHILSILRRIRNWVTRN